MAQARGLHVVESLKAIQSRELPGTWRDKRKGWGHAFHKLAPFVGGFPPRMANFFVRAFTTPGEVVLDPFSGGGTAPLEACVTGRVGWGLDAFPYAYVLTRAKVEPVSAQTAWRAFNALEKEAAAIERVDLDEEDVRAFYHPDTLSQLLRFRAALARRPDSPTFNFLRAVFCAILHGPSKMFLSWPMKETCSSTVGYIRRYFREHQVRPKRKNVRACFATKMDRTFVDGLPRTRGRAWLGDARELPVPDASVDFVLTSPPYMRVLDYTWNNWLRIWFLGLDRRSCREKLVLTSSEPRWREFMAACLAEVHRVLKEGRACVIVVGDVKKGSRVVNSASILAELALEVGLRPACVINDGYATRNRAMLVYNDLKYDSFDRDRDRHKLATPVDRCLVLEKGTCAAVRRLLRGV
ncbi:MAG: DNA methylase [Promethearchaeota archaeon]